MPKLESLNVIDVASPCPADWDAMAGDDRVRHCSQCNLNVYNLSDMTEDDALRLVNENEGRLCVRFFRRRDGTMLTRDCPVGLAAVRRKIARLWAGAAALAGAFFFGALLGRGAKAGEPAPLKLLAAPELREIKGDICIAPPMTAELIAAQHTPEALVQAIRNAKGQIGCVRLGQPDPDDESAMSERDRQAIEAKLNDAQWKGPAAGSKEHQLLIKYLGELLKRRPEAQLHISGIRPMLEPHIPHAEVMLGRMIVRPDLPKLELPKAPE